VESKGETNDLERREWEEETNDWERREWLGKEGIGERERVRERVESRGVGGGFGVGKKGVQGVGLLLSGTLAANKQKSEKRCQCDAGQP
jgi:hypothetical protein